MPWLRLLGRAVGGIDASSAELVKTNTAILAKAFQETEAFWTKRGVDEAVKVLALRAADVPVRVPDEPQPVAQGRSTFQRLQAAAPRR